MLVAGLNCDLSVFLQIIATVFVVIVGLLYLVKNTASKYFEVDTSFEGDQSGRSSMPGVLTDDSACLVCGDPGTKQCSRCKSVRYCSPKCQQKHWRSGHKDDCKVNKPYQGLSSAQNGSRNSQYQTSNGGNKSCNGIALVPACGISEPVNIKQLKEILFPYNEFVKLFSWDKPGYPPCGLLNCGNSCFVNVVLQCLASTRPLVAYLLEKGHRSECIRSDWCFLCELQTHIERASHRPQAFSPTNIISRLPHIGGNLGYGRQEDAHEFMRFAIDTMQSVCLDEFGGEKAVPPRLQETTVIQHIFGGHLQSQVICSNCNNISNQYENMMDLTVEIHGEATSLEECLDLFTAEECLQGDNMYKCDECNDYVKAWKRLTIKQAPNILTIALKRFQSGKFGKLNKKVTFPETLDLSAYTNDAGDRTDVYKLYGVVVHVDMLNSSHFGHYICFVKDFSGNWYRLDDCKVARVDLEEVLSQGAYMLFYSRVKARPSCLRSLEPLKDLQPMTNGGAEHSPKEHVNGHFTNGCSVGVVSPVSVLSNVSVYSETRNEESRNIHVNSDAITDHFNYLDGPSGGEVEEEIDMSSLSPTAGFDSDFNVSDHEDGMEVCGYQSSCFSVEKQIFAGNGCSRQDLQLRKEIGNGTVVVGCDTQSIDANNVKIYSNGYLEAEGNVIQFNEKEDGLDEVDSSLNSKSGVNSRDEVDSLKSGIGGSELQNGNGMDCVDILGDSS